MFLCDTRFVTLLSMCLSHVKAMLMAGGNSFCSSPGHAMDALRWKYAEYLVVQSAYKLEEPTKKCFTPHW
jgi:hypothetical protein